jgi:hypothetical protein
MKTAFCFMFTPSDLPKILVQRFLAIVNMIHARWKISSVEIQTSRLIGNFSTPNFCTGPQIAFF